VERLTPSPTLLEPFPDSAAAEGNELAIGGAPAASLAREFGTPLLVYCEQTLLARACAYLEASGGAAIAYSVKAFPNLAIMRLLAAEGLWADVASLGELAFAREAGYPGARVVVHGNNKSDEELAAASELGAELVVLDALEEVERAAAAGVRRILVRVTPGIDAETHDAIRTGHLGSKFGLAPDDAVEALRAAEVAGLERAGLHVHIGSQLLESGPAGMTVDWVAGFSVRCRAELGWTPAVVNMGGGLGIQHVPDERPPAIADFVGRLVERYERAWALHDLPAARLILEPGRSLVGPAGVTLYRVGVVKRATETVTYVAIDGGMSDNPRPQLYGARHTALLANRLGEEPSGVYSVCGKHCESGDVLVERLALPRPQRGDVLAVPATGAYTLAMGSNYNSVPRPAAVLVADGEARLIRRRETVDDLLACEA